jgi:dTDP-4-dehydrorhamnose reductase
VRKLLVTGASGFLGWHVCRAAATAGWQVLAVVNSRRSDIPSATVTPCDLCDPHALRHLFADASPDAVIHLAAASQPNYCQQHADETHRVNVDASLVLAELAAVRHVPFVFTSTDLVFDGRHPPYCESDAVSPICVYGEQKVAAEMGIGERHPQAAICRMPLMFGTAAPGGRSFVQQWVESLAAGRELTLFTDEFRTPVSARRAAAGLMLALGVGRGVLHLGGRERVSRHELGVRFARLAGLDEHLVKPARQADVPMPAPRSPDVSLDSTKAYATPGYDPGVLEEELRFCATTALG